MTQRFGAATAVPTAAGRAGAAADAAHGGAATTAQRPAPGAGRGDPLFDALGFRLMSLVRLTLALSGLLLAPSASGALAGLLFAYVVFSAVVHGFVLYREESMHSRGWHWLDVAWGLAVVAISGGAESFYYLFFIYPIIVGSMQRGRREGAAVTVGAVAGWLLIALLQEGPGAWPGHLSQAAPRALVLLVLGLAIAVWAGFESLQRRRLLLLGELNRLPNPRFGPEPLLVATLEQLRDFYRADDCVAVLAEEPEPMLCRARTRAADGLPAQAEMAKKLLSLPGRCVVVANAAPGWLPVGGVRPQIDRARGEEAAAARALALELTRDFRNRSWISVPLESSGEIVGRVVLLSSRRRFGAFDRGLLRQAMEKLMPLVETVRLLDRLATDAAERERRRIGLDLHDGAIQPYLGLKLALEALRRRAGQDHALAADIDELCRMAQDSVAEMRGYVRDLNGRTQRRAAALMEGLKRQAERFSSFYGMKIDMNIGPDIELNDRLAAELVQMVGEGLSNIGRHTSSRQVTINMTSAGGRLMTQIINHGAHDEADWQFFTPASLTRRAEQLGGSVEVARQDCGGTAVLVTIPL